MKPPPREIVVYAESIEIKTENAFLVGVVWIAHPDMRVETSGSLGQRFIDRFRMVGRRDGDNVCVSGAARQHLQ